MPIINNKMARVYRVGDVTLFPGLNQVSKEALDKCCTYALFDARVVAHDLEIRANDDLISVSSVSDAAGEKVPETKRLTVKEMEELIADVLNIGDLENIASSDDRKGVQNAVQAQLAKLRTANSKDEDEE